MKLFDVIFAPGFETTVTVGARGSSTRDMIDSYSIAMRDQPDKSPCVMLSVYSYKPAPQEATKTPWGLVTYLTPREARQLAMRLFWRSFCDGTRTKG